MCFQDQPLVSTSVQLTPHDIEKAKRILDEHDPRKAGRDGLQTVAIDQRDLEHDAELHGEPHRSWRGARRAASGDGVGCRGQSSCRAVRSVATSTSTPRCAKPGALPRFDRLKIGSVPVPGVLADYVLRDGLRRAVETDRGGLAADVVKGVKRRRRTAHGDLSMERRRRRARARGAGRSGGSGAAAASITTVSSRSSRRRRQGLAGDADAAAVPARARSRSERRHRPRDARRDRRAGVLRERQGTCRDRIGGKAMAAAGVAHGDAGGPRRFRRSTS